MESFSILKHWYAPSVGLDGFPRIFVDMLRRGLGVIRQASGPKEMGYVAYMPFGIIPFLYVLIIEKEFGAQLFDFLLDAHPSDKVVDPFFNREGTVLVTRFRILVA
jgi:hypothetical protein